MKDLAKTAAVIFLITALSQFLIRFPDYFRQVHTPPDKWYTGQVSWFDPWDMNVYFSAISSGMRHGFLFVNAFDTTPAPPMPLFPLYTSLGMIGKALQTDNTAVFHLSGMILALILGGVVWSLLGQFIPSFRWRGAGLFLVFLGGGLGWLFYPHPFLPDIALPGFMFESPLRRPHEAVSMALFLGAIIFFLRGEEKKKGGYYFLSALAIFAMLFFHPYSLLPLGLVVATFGVYCYFVQRPTGFILQLALWGGAAAGYFLLTWKSLLSHPGFSGLLSQAQSSPSPFLILLSWGALLPPLVLAAVTRPVDRRGVFLRLWLVCQLAVIYFPLGFQRLMIRGILVPVVILSLEGVSILAHRCQIRPCWVAVVILALSVLSPLFIFHKRLTETAGNRWVYLTKEEGEIISWLQNNGPAGAGVLASYQIANLLPARTDKTVYAGHAFQTPNFPQRMGEVEQFFAGRMTGQEAQEFLRRARIKYIFSGPGEKMFRPEGFAYPDIVQEIITNKEVVLYRVN